MVFSRNKKIDFEKCLNKPVHYLKIGIVIENKGYFFEFPNGENKSPLSGTGKRGYSS